MTIIERVNEQMRSAGNRPVWYYSVVVLIALWMLFGLMSLVDIDDWFVLNYLLTSPLLIGALYMDRHRVRVTGNNREYIESSWLLNRWVLGRGRVRAGIRICLLILFFASQIPVVALSLWYVGVVRRRALVGRDSPSERPAALTDALERGSDLRAQARNYRESEKYGHALDTYDEARAAYANARETASEHDLATDEIDQKIAAVENERREVHRHQLEGEVASIRSDLDRATTRAEEGEGWDVKETLADLKSQINSVKEAAAHHDFDALHEEIVKLNRRRHDLMTEVTERREARFVPEKLPTSPEVSVDYDALTNKERIGSGGNADVMKAKLSTPDGDVTLAIKKPRMSGTLHIETVERLLEEAETWAKLDNHDHIVAVVDYGNDPMPWIAMEYMDGGHLGQRSNDIEMQQALWTSIAVTKGVRHAHRRGVAHLDLKPENILFRTVDGAWDVPKVADWGLSKHLLEHSQSVEGFSPQYAAPEQFSDEYGLTDDVTDVYQLGGVFYELFTGRPPFEGGPARVMREVLDVPPRSPSEVADVPEALDDILLTALAKERADRYESVLYLRDALQNLYDDW